MAKILIAYYSRKGQNYVNGSIKNLAKGNTEIVAEFIQMRLTLLKIIPSITPNVPKLQRLKFAKRRAPNLKNICRALTNTIQFF